MVSVNRRLATSEGAAELSPIELGLGLGLGSMSSLGSVMGGGGFSVVVGRVSVGISVHD